jgi:hypothetical protein
MIFKEINSLTELVEVGVRELGYHKGRETVQEYLKFKKEYEKNNEPPNYRDREAKRAYDDRRDLYALSSTYKWIEASKEVRL